MMTQKEPGCRRYGLHPGSFYAGLEGETLQKVIG